MGLFNWQRWEIPFDLNGLTIYVEWVAHLNISWATKYHLLKYTPSEEEVKTHTQCFSIS